MKSKHYIVFAVAALVAAGIFYQYKYNRVCTKKTCLNDPNCLCYCSRKCGFRRKESDDRPIWVEHDKYGYHCYCKQRDYDTMSNCIKSDE